MSGRRLQMMVYLSLITVFKSLSTGAKSDKEEEWKVSFDHRALVIDGERRFLISGSIHYPRSTPEMWPGLITLAKGGGLDVVDTYVFWNGHEPERGQYYFEGRYDLVHFLNIVAAAGLLVTLRIGPYVCAEWNLGGFPEWLREIPGIEFRTDNEPFKLEMQRWTTHIVNHLSENQLFYSQGGPIILTQVENEYDHVAAAYGEPGRRYSSWAAQMAHNLSTPVPWIMCLQKDAPPFIIDTHNGDYGESFTPNDQNKPKLWTENYPGWLHLWGEPLQARPVQDIAYAVARFFQTGGSYMNYYVYHGGTNFGRTAARRMTTSYDYTAPIDEYGQARQPMWEHLKNLHLAIRKSAPALAAVNGQPLSWSPELYVEVYVYQTEHEHVKNFQRLKRPPGLCAAFLSNGRLTDVVVEFMGRSYSLPAWSDYLSIFPGTAAVAHNSERAFRHDAVFLNGESPKHEPTPNSSGFYQRITLRPGLNTLDILSVTSGFPASGAFLEKMHGGVTGSVRLRDDENKMTDLTNYQWIIQVGLRGEYLNLESPDSASAAWSGPTAHPPTNHSLVWYKTVLDAPAGEGPALLDLGSMKKGAAWINGHHLGRYWPQILNPAEGCEKPCVIIGKWYAAKCVVNCGQPSQRWYHVPRSWLKMKDNTLVLFEEVGGNPNGVSFSTQIEHD
ncbi:hypothetical protein R1flu_021300 [Riccia fluitans]|uniref:Beta-galactosidase n=1 Tax=Riccia fluitans TaxID=41844 RepID=A0ABD1ZPH9_9MARC